MYKLYNVQFVLTANYMYYSWNLNSNAEQKKLYKDRNICKRPTSTAEHFLASLN
jgi:hypothetical protein